MRVLGGYRRNDLSPIKGIDTNKSHTCPHPDCSGRNDLSPIKGIDTSKSMWLCVKHGRNDLNPTKGIDTIIIATTSANAISRNNLSPTKGIDTPY